MIPFPVRIIPLPHISYWLALPIAEADETDNLPNKAGRNPPDRIVLDDWALLSSICVNILLAEIFLILVFCLVVKNISWASSSSWRVSFLIVNVIPVLFFAVDFDLSSWLFVSLLLLLHDSLVDCLLVWLSFLHNSPSSITLLHFLREF